MRTLQIDLRVAELLASRLCHDLVSPIGAVNNGMELLEEDLDPEMAGDAVRLASDSARQASATVQFFRLAYGQAGRQIELQGDEIKRLTEAYLAHHKANLDWRADAIGEGGPDGSGKLLLNMIALALESLPRGGTIATSADLARGARIVVVARGQGVRLREESRAALDADADIEALTPRSVQAYFTQIVARRLGGTLEAAESADGLTFEAQVTG